MTIQQAIKTMISEEWIAGQLYLLWSNGPEKSTVGTDLLYELFEDEIEDHYIELCEIAKELEFKIPASVDDYLKFASKPFVDMYNDGMKQNKDLKWYIENAIDGELAAIASYEAVLNECESDLNERPELKEVVLNNYYEELEHHHKLKFLLLQLDTIEIAGDK